MGYHFKNGMKFTSLMSPKVGDSYGEAREEERGRKRVRYCVGKYVVLIYLPSSWAWLSKSWAIRAVLSSAVADIV